jgi:hypothetical protein
MNANTKVFNIIGWIVGLLFSFIGIVNMFWGNDAIFGVFLFGLSLIFYPPLTSIIKKLSGINIPGYVKLIIGLLFLWMSLGVGELFAKLALMKDSLS